MIFTSYPASSSGVEMARMPSGAVASILEKEGTKKTILFEDFTRLPLGGCGDPQDMCSIPSCQGGLATGNSDSMTKWIEGPKVISSKVNDCRSRVKVM